MGDIDETEGNDEVNIRPKKRDSTRLSRPIAVVEAYFDDSESEDIDDEADNETEETEQDDTNKGDATTSLTLKEKDVSKVGFLAKRGGKKNNQGWKKRWFTFDGKCLKYFTNQKSQISLRIIPVAQMITVNPLNIGRPGSRASSSSSSDLFRFSARQYQFSLECKQRTFVLGTDTLENSQTWQSHLMAAIIDYQKKDTGDPLHGGEMNNPEKSGSIRFNKNKKKYFVALKNGILRYYYNEDDYAIDSPIHELNVSVIRVIEIDKTTLQIDSPPSQRFILHFDTATETVSWKTQLENAIADILGDNEVYDIVKQTEGNDKCADCGSKDPKWASINLGIVICIKCAGPHRSLGSHISKVRSLRMDNIFRKNEDLVKLLSEIGNIRSNRFWVSNPVRTIDDQTPNAVRYKHIEEVYRDRKYVVGISTSQEELNKALFSSVQNQDLLGTMEALFSGADMHHRDEAPDRTVTEIVEQTDNTVLKLFLELNSNTDFRNTPQESSKTEVTKCNKKSSVYYEGFLEKTGPNLKGYQKRWCVLHYGTITYYADSNKPVEKGCIDLSNATSISSVIGNRQYSFDICTTLKGSRVYRLAAGDKQSMQEWVNLLSKVLGPHDQETFNDSVMLGYFYCKFYNTQQWTKVWLVLREQHLFIRSVDNVRTEEVDMSQKFKCFQCNVGKHVDNADNVSGMSNNHRVEVVPADMSSIISIQGVVLKDTKKLYSLIQPMSS